MLEALIFDLSFFHVIARVLLCVCVRRVRACVHCHARAHVQERGRERERGCAQRWWLKRCDAGGGPKQGERKGAAEEGAPGTRVEYSSPPKEGGGMAWKKRQV